jgi:hypothetical protein
MMSAAASVGLLNLWDVDGGLSKIDPYLYLSEDYIKASRRAIRTSAGSFICTGCSS